MQDYKSRPSSRRRGSRRTRRRRLSPDGPAALRLPALPEAGRAPEAEGARWRAGLARLRSWSAPRPEMLFALGLVWLLIATAWGLYRVWEAPLTQVAVRGEAALTRVQVAAAGGLAPGIPIRGLDPYTTALRLLEHPRIAQAHVRRVLPGGVLISIQERTPAAWVAFAGGGRALVDAAGVVLELYPNDGAGAAATRLPHILTAATATRPGSTLGDPGVSRGLRLADQLDRLLKGAMEPLRIDATDPFTQRVSLPGRGLTLLLPVEDAGQALATWQAVAPALAAEVPPGTVVDLRAVEREGPGWIVLGRSGAVK